MNKLFKTYNIVDRVDCGCVRKTKGAGTIIPFWDIIDKDEIVTESPKENVIEIHNCNKIKVWQEYKGLKRYFLL